MKASSFLSGSILVLGVPQFLAQGGTIENVNFHQTQWSRQLKGKGPRGRGSGRASGTGSYQYNEDDCAICTPDNKIRPGILTVQYFGGTGSISRFQDEEKATCRNQNFPVPTTIYAYGEAYPAEEGTIITLGEEGFKMDAETDFTFSGSSIECFIHTSCSQPLVAGDQIGPFLILEGNDCSYTSPFCGDGKVDNTLGETCDPLGSPSSNSPNACREDCTHCGDGNVDEVHDETCDPPGMAMGGGTTGECRNDCTYCGDGKVNGNEECDEGSKMPSNTCEDCRIPKWCGDGIVNENEECDEGDKMPSPTCEDCKLLKCGDGKVNGNGVQGETCDPPGKVMSGGAMGKCRNDCTYCGDGIVNGDEECDEGGNMPSRTCEDCKLPKCGDGKVNGDEECDEGDSMPSPTCENCRLPKCGDGKVNGNKSHDETCDPPGMVMGGSTRGICRLDCTYCGDGTVNGEEECDEGAKMPSQTCEDCKLPQCGDGKVNGSEECDEGGNMPSLTCDRDCKVPRCGDGKLNGNEARVETCDPPGTAMGGGKKGKCRKDCTYCGDGQVNGNEECDEGGNMPSNTCKGCQIPKWCGDGIVNGDEECDEGGNMPSRTCENCKLPKCGDGKVNGNEECDEGEKMPSKTCDACNIPACVCEANGRYDSVAGTVTIDFDLCDDAEPREDDFVAIYPCQDTDLLVTDQGWFDFICNGQLKSMSYKKCEQLLFSLGYEKDHVYPHQSNTWMSFTCGDAGDGCQNRYFNAVWPSKSSVTIDPDAFWDARWAFPFSGPTLEPGCYKVLIQREIKSAISAPPYPSVCKDWYEANEFIVS